MKLKRGAITLSVESAPVLAVKGGKCQLDEADLRWLAFCAVPAVLDAVRELDEAEAGQRQLAM